MKQIFFNSFLFVFDLFALILTIFFILCLTTQDHIGEVLRKWDQIDDEIWAKMIFMSRNRRIAKAYVRVPAVIVNGSDDGFDGFKVGLNGFDDPFRDGQTEQMMDYIDEVRQLFCNSSSSNPEGRE